jgi:hypothetical protein
MSVTPGFIVGGASQGVDGDGEGDDHADHHLLNKGRDAEQVEAIAQYANDQYAHQGAADAADAATEAGAANHHGGDGVQLQAQPGTRLRRVQARGQGHRGDAGQRTADGVHPQGNRPHLDARQPRHFRAAAHGVEVAATGTKAQEHPGHHQHHQEQAHGGREETKVAHRREAGEPVRVADDLPAFGKDIRQATGHRHHGQRGNKGWQLGVGDQPAGDQPGEHAAGNRDRNRKAQGHRLILIQPAEHHHREGQHRADRQVDAADHDHRCHADRQDAQHRDLIEDVQAIAQRKEEFGTEGEDQHQQHQPDQRAADITGQQFDNTWAGWRLEFGRVLDNSFGVHSVLLSYFFWSAFRRLEYLCVPDC